MSEDQDIWGKLGKLANIESKAGLEGLTALFIILLATIFTILFLSPYEVIIKLPTYLTYPTIWVLFLIIRILLFGSDDLYYGDPRKNKYAKAFQEDLPSIHLAARLKITSSEAEYIWFEKIFNPMSDRSHARHDQWSRTLQRGYSCRFVYYFIKTLQIMLYISIFLFIIQIILPSFNNLIPGIPLGIFHIKDGTAPRLIFIIVILSLLLIARWRNNPKIESLTGVWKKFSEINQLHKKWIDENIKSIGDLRELGK